MIRLALIEDDDTTLESLTYLLHEEGFHITGAYASAEEFLAQWEGELSRPHIVLLDLALPGMSGLEAIRAICDDAAAPEIIVLTVSDDRDSLFAALKAGATGYILKDAPLEMLKGAIEEVMDGGAPMSPRIARMVLDEFRSPAGCTFNLSQREQEVLQALVEGYTYDELARKLYIASGTVQAHLKRIYRKLNVHSRTEAVTKALRNRLVE